jgi:GDP-4-dehydro-6-deoxy-D-mannose reductase
MSKILVTGSTGFVGKHLVPGLKKAQHETFEANSRSGDIAEALTWKKFPKTDVVIHLAGKSFVPASWSDPASFINCNLMGTVTALNYCREHDSRLIFISSYLYGNPLELPIPETATLNPTNPYALSKKLAEDVCRFYSDSLGVNITILRPFNVYGPGQDENFLLPSIIRQVSSGKDIVVKDLEPKRDYIYINDLVDALIGAVTYESKFDIFNIGSGKSHSVQELIQITQNTYGTELPVHSDEERRKDEIMDTRADITLAKLKLHWEPKWTLEEGIRQIFDSELRS